jgi:hypothetical protein
MPFQRSPRPLSVLASGLAAAIIGLAVAGCGHVTPLGPGPTPVAAPVIGPPRQLQTPFVLKAVRVESSANGCPAGYAAVAGDPGTCYRQLGTPVTVTTASVSAGSVVSGTSGVPAGQYGFWLVLPTADQSALHAMTAAAAAAQGNLGISIGGQTWLLPRVGQAFTGPLEIFSSDRSRIVQFYNQLSASPVVQAATPAH